MVKFASSEDTGYKTASGHLWLLAKEAPNAISVRWVEQDKIKKCMENDPNVRKYCLGNNNNL